MKKNLLKFFAIFLLLPAIMFVGCKNAKLPAIKLSGYLKDEITVISYGLLESDGTLSEESESLSLLTEKKAKTENLSKYLKFTLTANPVTMYKMYVEYISFYVYCNESAEQMTINVTMSNLASEDDIRNATNQSVETDTAEEQVAFKVKAKKSVKCTIPIKKTVATATGSTITIDIFNSRDLFSGDGENDSTFKWLIYGFEIHGEPRAYTRNAE